MLTTLQVITSVFYRNISINNIYLIQLISYNSPLEKTRAILMSLVSFSQHSDWCDICCTCYGNIDTLKCLQIMCIVTQYIIGISVRMHYVPLRSRYVLHFNQSRVSEPALLAMVLIRNITVGSFCKRYFSCLSFFSQIVNLHLSVHVTSAKTLHKMQHRIQSTERKDRETKTGIVGSLSTPRCSRRAVANYRKIMKARLKSGGIEPRCAATPKLVRVWRRDERRTVSFSP